MRSVSRYRPRRRHRDGVNYKKIGTMVTLVVFVFMIFSIFRFFSLFNALKGSENPAIWRPESRERTQFLVVGLGGDELRAVTLISVPKDPDMPVALLKIPPESLTIGEDKSALSQVWQSGESDLVASVNQLLGYRLRVDKTFIYDMEGIPQLVSALNNVVFTLEDTLRVSQGNTDFVFHKDGTNTLTKDNVLPLLAHGLGDPRELISLHVQNRVLTSVFNDLFVMKNIGNLIDNIKLVRKYHSTDMGTRELSRFRDTLAALDSENSLSLYLPGQWITVGGQRLWSTEEGTVGLIAQQIVENIAPYNRGELTVDVLNGNGIQGFASKTATILTTHGFRVEEVKNAGRSDLAITEIHYRPGYRLAALELGMLLATEPALIEGTYPNSKSPVVIVLGKDLEGS